MATKYEINPFTKDMELVDVAPGLASHEADLTNPHEVTLEQARTQDNQIDGDIDFNNNDLLNGGSLSSYGRDVIRYSRR